MRRDITCAGVAVVALAALTVAASAQPYSTYPTKTVRVSVPTAANFTVTCSITGSGGAPRFSGLEQALAEPDTQVLRDHLESRGEFGSVFCAPATSRNRAMVRLTLSAALTDAELDHIEAVAREVAPIVQPWDWPIARRASRRARSPRASRVRARRRRRGRDAPRAPPSHRVRH